MPAGIAENALLAAWSDTLAKFGDRRAVLDANGGTLRTFADLEAECGEYEHRLACFAPGTVSAIQMGNRACWPALLLALFRRGLIPLPLGQHMERDELADALETCGAGALIEAEGDGLRIVQRATNVQRKPPDADFLKLTSGTTSAPRAVRFRAHHLLADCEQICTTMGLGPDDRNYGAIPFSHSYGFSNLLTPLLCRGVPLVASEDRFPRAMLDGLASSGATIFPGIPVFFQKLAALENATALPRLRLCISAGAPLPPAIGYDFTARFGLKIHTFYGASECGGIAYDAGEAVRYEEGFVGTTMAGVSISKQENGRVAVRSAAAGDGYFPEPDPALCDGVFVPGDLVEWTPRGLILVGRASDFINVAGRKLNPATVEQCLLGCPGVRQAVLFGVASVLRGEEAVACVAGEDLDAAAVLRFCQTRLSRWQVPRAIWIVPEIATNERGKISRRALAESYRARSSA